LVSSLPLEDYSFLKPVSYESIINQTTDKLVQNGFNWVLNNPYAEPSFSNWREAFFNLASKENKETLIQATKTAKKVLETFSCQEKKDTLKESFFKEHLKALVNTEAEQK
jgi:hypothetical protein